MLIQETETSDGIPSTHVQHRNLIPLETQFSHPQKLSKTYSTQPYNHQDNSGYSSGTGQSGHKFELLKWAIPPAAILSGAYLMQKEEDSTPNFLAIKDCSSTQRNPFTDTTLGYSESNIDDWVNQALIDGKLLPPEGLDKELQTIATIKGKNVVSNHASDQIYSRRPVDNVRPIPDYHNLNSRHFQNALDKFTKEKYGKKHTAEILALEPASCGHYGGYFQLNIFFEILNSVSRVVDRGLIQIDGYGVSSTESINVKIYNRDDSRLRFITGAPRYDYLKNQKSTSLAKNSTDDQLEPTTPEHALTIFSKLMNSPQPYYDGHFLGFGLEKKSEYTPSDIETFILHCLKKKYGPKADLQSLDSQFQLLDNNGEPFGVSFGVRLKDAFGATSKAIVTLYDTDDYEGIPSTSVKQVFPG